MNKSEFIIYISTDNPGFYKTRKEHINKRFPNILKEIEGFNVQHNIIPLNFNDAVKYYINDTIIQTRCKICNKIISHSSIYCSYNCKNKDINFVLDKTRQTLFDKNGSISPLGSKEAKEKKEQTCLEKFGYKHPSSNDEIKKKIKETNIETYKDPEVRNNLSKSMKLAHEKDSVGIIHKQKQTNFNKTGEYTTLTTDTIKKIKNTLTERYNTSNPFSIHEDTYEKAKQGCLRFYNNEINIKNAIQKRINSIISKYGSLEKMNEYVFEKTKHKVINNLIEIGLTDKIINYSHNNLGFIKCFCQNCNKEYEISLILLKDRIRKQNTCCINCFPPEQWRSLSEIQVYNWLSQYIECESNNKKILKGSEIDIFIPSKNIAIEYNGIYWHSDLYKDKNYHLNKTLFLKNKDIQLIHIWEDLWESKKDIIKERILSKLKINQTNIGARECILKEIESKEANDFYEYNHLQGKTKAFKYIALLNDDEIISCLSIGKRKLGKNKGDNFEILRFCTKLGINCIGAFSKLFKYVINNYNGKYISYADLCWGEGNVYEKAGFKLTEYSKPNYWYFIDGKRYHRYTFNKQNLIKMGYDKNKTEFQIMNERGALRVYDSGNAIWEYEY